jgi:ketosteroid isomerase-like protein
MDPLVRKNPGVLTREFAVRFAEEWVAAWNSHDLERILSHYTDDFEMASPIIVQLMGEPSGTLKGKQAVREYWAKALARLPDLRFELIDVYVGAESVVIHYRGPRGASAEAFWFDPEGKVRRAAAHYLKAEG